MFDHLEPTKFPTLKVSPHHHFSLSVLMLAGFSLLITFALPLASYTQSQPVTPGVVLVWPDVSVTQPRFIVTPIDNVELTKINFGIYGAPAQLKKINFTVDGVLERNDISTMKLYLDDVQVGHDAALNDRGVVSFQLDSVSLPLGEHSLALRSNWLIYRPAQAITVSLASQSDLELWQNNKKQTVETVYPVTTNLLSTISKGVVKVAQLNSPTVSADLTKDQQHVNFTLPWYSQGERVDINRLTWNVSSQDFNIASVSLVENDQRLKSWPGSQLNSNGVEVTLATSSVSVNTSVGTTHYFQVRGNALRPGARITLSLKQAYGRGAISGADIIWDEGYEQSRFLVNDQPQFKVVSSDLTNGYALQLTTLSGQPISVSEAYLEVGSQVPLMRTWKVLVDNDSVQNVSDPLSDGSEKIRFPTAVKISNHSVITFAPTPRNRDASNPDASMRLMENQLAWSTNYTGWYSVDRSGLPPAEATMIKLNQ